MAKPTVTVSPEVCCVQCTTVYDQCCAIPGADITVCKEAYTVCLGYSPFDSNPYVAPTVCHYEPEPPHHGGGTCECGTGSCFTPEICGVECTTVYEECCSIEGADIEICKKQYTVCLGYSSFDSVSFVKPVCKHEQSYYIEYESQHDSHYFEEKYSSYYESSSSSHSTSSYHEGYYTAEYCCAECTTVYDQCCSVPGADITVCKESYTICLGYNPFEIVPFHEPTVCKHEESYYSEYESQHGEEYYNSEYDNYHHEDYDVEVDVEQCCIECTTVYDECCKVAGADIAICKEEYTVCLGYSPFDVTPYVAPTVCKHGNSDNTGYEHGSSDNTGYEHGSSDNTGYEHGDNSSSDSKSDNHGDYSSGSSSSEEECSVQCTTVYDECCSADSHDIETCKTEYTTCLGYSPFDVTPYVKPTVCKHGDTSGSDSKSDSHGDYSDKTGSDSKGNSNSGDYSDSNSKGGDHSGSSSSSGSDEECCVKCTTVYKACCDAAGALVETCKTAYSTCLGYSPFDVTPYVEPTVCKKGSSSSDDIVIVSGGETVRPVLALLVIGVVALL
jgi:hypothetical protein